jgi:hypothetical protein
MDLKRDLSEDEMDEYNYGLSNKKIRNEISGELKTYQHSFNSNSNGHNIDAPVINTLILKNMELTERLAEYKINNTLLQKNINNLESQNNIKNNYSNSQMEELTDFKNKDESNQKNIVKLNNIISRNNSVMFWQKFIIIFEMMLLSLLVINADSNLLFNLINN